MLALFKDLGIALADVLLSTQGSDTGIDIPSVDHDWNVARSVSTCPTRLRRKFFRIRHRRSAGTFLACGTVRHIEQVIENARMLRSYQPSLPAALRRYLEQGNATSMADAASTMAEHMGAPDFELLGIVDGLEYCRGFVGQNFESSLPYWGRIRCMGSGAALLLDWLEKRGALLMEHGHHLDDPEQRAIRAAHLTPTLLLEGDRLTKQTLAEGVGGFYEVYSVGDDGLLPLGNILFISAALDVKRGRRSIRILRLAYHVYDGDWLIIGVLKGPAKVIGVDAPATIPMNEFHTYEIPPLDVEERTPVWTAQRLSNHLNSAHTVRLSIYRGTPELMYRFYELGEAPRKLVRAKTIDGRITLHLDCAAFDYYTRRTSPETRKWQG